MKKALIKLSALATIGLVMASCSNEEANKKAAEADNAAIQTLVDSKTANIDAEVSAACDAKVNESAQAIVDSLAKATPAKAVAKAVTPVKKAPVKPAAPAKKEEPKKGFGGKVGDDAGSTKAGGFGGQVKDANSTTTETPKKKGFGGQVK
ncbi:MAG: hypothetical protein JNL95_06040 [Chitinophagales bacterium]|nr:hypothetical protein [Chitinophagales bacterium]